MKEFIMVMLRVFVLFLAITAIDIVRIQMRHYDRLRIIYAIYDYKVHAKCTNSLSLVDFEDMEPCQKTYKRWSLRSYEHILPIDKTELIRPYIKSYSTIRKLEKNVLKILRGEKK